MTDKPKSQSWSDICRAKNNGMKCDSEDKCRSCVEKATGGKTDG